MDGYIHIYISLFQTVGEKGVSACLQECISHILLVGGFSLDTVYICERCRWRKYQIGIN